MPKPSTPLLNQRKKQDLETKEKNDQAKPGKLKEDFKPSSVYFYNVEQQKKKKKGFPNWVSQIPGE